MTAIRPTAFVTPSTLAAGALAMSLSLTAAFAAPFPKSPDAAAIETVVESVATLADRHEFEALERLYAPEVRVDYSSLTGGQPEVKSAAALMTQWAGVLPGFDRTRHALDKVRVTVEGDTARATAEVVADHWIGELHWQVSGRYEYGLVRDGRDWRIASHSLTVTGERGTRAVFAPAAEAARAAPVPYLARQQARAVVMDFLTGLEDKDMARVNGVWAEDAVQEMPYAPAGFPRRVEGREALVKQYAGWPQNAGKASFTQGIRFYPTQDPQIVAVEFHGVSEIIPTGRTYDQRYFGLFHVEGGKITLFREYFDPNVFTHAFGLNEGGAFFERK
ncbi:MAG TPA: nuclear transport factor 2 family protein [Azospirillaceae bacterium]|nr:nuclear transport factor 2 family protein [Azospirillaceae bacterium]